MVWSRMPGWQTFWRVYRSGRKTDWKSCCPLRDLPSPGEWYLPSGVRAAGHNPQSGVERLTTGNEPEQRPRGLTVSQNLNQPGAIPGAVLHHLPSVPVSVLRDLTQLPDSVLQNPPPIPAWRSPRRNRINQPSSDCDHSYASLMMRPKNASIWVRRNITDDTVCSYVPSVSEYLCVRVTQSVQV